MNDQIICETTEEHSHAEPSTTLINPSLCESTQTQIQGVSGATYAPMDTSPQTPEQQQNARVKMLMEMLTTALNGLVKELQTPTQPQTDLEEAVSTMLENAEWFKERVEDTAKDLVEEQDFAYEINNAVEQELRNLDINDHCDFDEMVRDAVDDKLEDIVTEKLEELLEEKLANARITVNF
jgi:predicted  nucleic acid-binding Zn-ribbon protein